MPKQFGSIVIIPEVRTNKIDSNPPNSADILFGSSVNAQGNTFYGFPTPVNSDWVATKGYVDLQISGISAGGIPTGVIMMWPTTTAPAGWLLCDGTSTSGYTALAALVGATTPDLRSRFPVGAGSHGAVLTTDGASEATRGTAFSHLHAHTGAAHTHTLASHQHNLNGHTHLQSDHTHSQGTLVTNLSVVSNAPTGGTTAKITGPADGNISGATGAGTNPQTGGPSNANSGGPSVADTGGASAVNTGNSNLASSVNEHPYLALNFIIKT